MRIKIQYKNYSDSKAATNLSYLFSCIMYLIGIFVFGILLLLFFGIGDAAYGAFAGELKWKETIIEIILGYIASYVIFAGYMSLKFALDCLTDRIAVKKRCSNLNFPKDQVKMVLRENTKSLRQSVLSTLIFSVFVPIIAIAITAVVGLFYAVPREGGAVITTCSILVLTAEFLGVYLTIKKRF